MSALPMIVDSFAGGGGASTGIEMALGRSPDAAINHNPAALALHAANHPDTIHLDSNIWDVDPLTVTGGRHLGLLWASPDCKHFSKAKGGAPRDRNIRDLAWVVVKWAEEAKPDVICMENVEEFVTWGPVDGNGQPIRELAGVTYELWIKRLRKAGYRIQSRELRACDFGAPTIRKRWFLVARRDGRPIVWPKPTHGDPASAAVRKGKLLPWRTAADCIDWSLPCPSIFATSAEIMAEHGLRAVRPLAGNTMARIARGMKRYVMEAGRPFLVSLKGTDRRASAAADPHPTVLAGGGHSALIAPSLTRFNGGATGQDLRDPMVTITANSYIKRPGGCAPLGLLVPYLATFYGHGGGRGERTASLSDPLRTVTTENRHALLAPVLTYAQQGGGNRSAEAPHHTICASRKDQNSLLVASIVGCGGRAGQSRPRGADEPFATVTAKADACLAAATLIQTGYGERQGQAPRALDIGAPLGTVVAGGIKHAVAAAFLAQQNGGPRMGAHAGHNFGNPISTIAASGSHQTPVAAWFAKYYGTGDGARTDEPCHTITVKDRMGHMQAELAVPPFAPEHEARARQVAEFLRAHDAWSGGEFAAAPDRRHHLCGDRHRHADADPARALPRAGLPRRLRH